MKTKNGRNIINKLVTKDDENKTLSYFMNHYNVELKNKEIIHVDEVDE